MRTVKAKLGVIWFTSLFLECSQNLIDRMAHKWQLGQIMLERIS